MLNSHASSLRRTAGPPQRRQIVTRSPEFLLVGLGEHGSTGNGVHALPRSEQRNELEPLDRRPLGLPS